MADGHLTPSDERFGHKTRRGIIILWGGARNDRWRFHANLWACPSTFYLPPERPLTGGVLSHMSLQASEEQSGCPVG